MKNLILIFNSIFVSSVFCQSSDLNQNLYLWQDALTISKQIQASTSNENIKEKLAAILTKYYFTTNDLVPYETVYIQASKNPFLVKVLPKPSTPLTEINTNSADLPTLNAGDLGQFINPTTVLDALGQLIQKRVLDELNLAYLDDLRRALDSQKVLKALLPTTHQSLTNFGKSHTLNYKSYLASLRNHCREDLQQLPKNLATFIKGDRDAILSKLKLNCDEYVMILATLNLLENAKNRPEDILSSLGNLEYNLPQDSCSKLANLLEFVGLVSDRLRLNDPVGQWLPKTTRNELFKTTTGLYIFLGLIYEVDANRLKALKFPNGQSLYELMGASNALAFIKKVDQIVTITRDLDFILSKANTPGLNENDNKPKSFDIPLVGRILTTVLNGTDELFTFKDQKDIVKKTLDIQNNLEQKNYASAIVKAYSFVSNDTSTLYKISIYAEFFDAIVRETNADSLVYILSAFAAPVGSYSIKRRSPFNVSLSSFPGALGGNETLLGENISTKNKQAINSFAFTAPFGLALSKAISAKDSRGGHSLTVFFPLVDVGAITAFRFENGTAELPQVTWKNFFSPGAYLIFGIRQSPISLNAGFQYGPELRKIEVDKTPELVPSRRFSLGLTLDLHLFNLSHRLPSSESSKSGS